MGDAAGETAHGLHLLRVAQLLFQQQPPLKRIVALRHDGGEELSGDRPQGKKHEQQELRELHRKGGERTDPERGDGHAKQRDRRNDRGRAPGAEAQAGPHHQREEDKRDRDVAGRKQPPQPEHQLRADDQRQQQGGRLADAWPGPLDDASAAPREDQRGDDHDAKPVSQPPQHELVGNIPWSDQAAQQLQRDRDQRHDQRADWCHDERQHQRVARALQPGIQFERTQKASVYPGLYGLNGAQHGGPVDWAARHVERKRPEHDPRK